MRCLPMLRNLGSRASVYVLLDVHAPVATCGLCGCHAGGGAAVQLQLHVTRGHSVTRGHAGGQVQLFMHAWVAHA